MVSKTTLKKLMDWSARENLELYMKIINMLITTYDTLELIHKGAEPEEVIREDSNHPDHIINRQVINLLEKSKKDLFAALTLLLFRYTDISVEK